MRKVLLGAALGLLAAAAGTTGALAEPWYGDGVARATPVADYPEPRPYGYGPPPTAPGYGPPPPPPGYGPPPPPPGYGPPPPPPGAYYGGPQRYGYYGPPPRPRPRCWVRQGYDGPERVCRW